MLSLKRKATEALSLEQKFKKKAENPVQDQNDDASTESVDDFMVTQNLRSIDKGKYPVVEARNAEISLLRSHEIQYFITNKS